MNKYKHLRISENWPISDQNLLQCNTNAEIGAFVSCKAKPISASNREYFELLSTRDCAFKHGMLERLSADWRTG